MMSMYDLEKEIREEVRERAKELWEDIYPEDTLHEMADSAIPIYYSDLVELLADDTSLSTVNDPGLIEGVNDVFKIIQTAIYERLIQEAYSEWEDVNEMIGDRKCDHCGEPIWDDLEGDSEFCDTCTPIDCAECGGYIFPDDIGYDIGVCETCQDEMNGEVDRGLMLRGREICP